MKKHLLVLLAICLGGLMAVSCNHDENNDGGGNGNNNNDKITVQYQMLDSYKLNSETVHISPCFHYNIKYVDVNGKTVELNNISAPWSIPSFDTKAPYTALIEGDIIYNESELPDGPVIFGAIPKINILQNGTMVVYDNDNTNYFNTKEKFLEFIATHQDRLHFKVEHKF